MSFHFFELSVRSKIYVVIVFCQFIVVGELSTWGYINTQRFVNIRLRQSETRRSVCHDATVGTTTLAREPTHSGHVKVLVSNKLACFENRLSNALGIWICMVEFEHLVLVVIVISF